VKDDYCCGTEEVTLVKKPALAESSKTLKKSAEKPSASRQPVDTIRDSHKALLTSGEGFLPIGFPPMLLVTPISINS